MLDMVASVCADLIPTVSTWHAALRKFLHGDKRLRTGIITASTGLSGVEVSKDHENNQLVELTAELGAFYSNMVEIRRRLLDNDSSPSSSDSNAQQTNDTVLEIGFGHVFTKNGASHKHFVSVTNKQPFPNRMSLTAFLAARGRTRGSLLNKWLALYNRIAPEILEVDADTEWHVPPWDFMDVGKNPAHASARYQAHGFFWDHLTPAASDKEQELRDVVKLLILSLEHMLAFKSTQGLWFEHHLVTATGSMIPQYFIFLFPTMKGTVGGSIGARMSRFIAVGTMSVVLPLSFRPKCRTFIQVLANMEAHANNDALGGLTSLTKQWYLNSELAKKEILSILEHLQECINSDVDANAIRSRLHQFQLLEESID